MTIKKNDIVALVTTTVSNFAFGSGQAPIKNHRIDVVRVAAASRGGRVRKYQTYIGSPVYAHHDQYGRTMVLTIGGEMQERAARLFAAAASHEDLRFTDQESAKAAIAAA